MSAGVEAGAYYFVGVHRLATGGTEEVFGKTPFLERSVLAKTSPSPSRLSTRSETKEPVRLPCRFQSHDGLVRKRGMAWADQFLNLGKTVGWVKRSAAPPFPGIRGGAALRLTRPTRKLIGPGGKAQGRSVFLVGGDSCRRFAAFCCLAATNRRQESPPTIRIFNN
jgi:hypothetical protein